MGFKSPVSTIVLLSSAVCFVPIID